MSDVEVNQSLEDICNKLKKSTDREDQILFGILAVVLASIKVNTTDELLVYLTPYSKHQLNILMENKPNG